MYSTVLTVHSLVRWIVLIAGVLAAGKAIFGWLRNLDWTAMDDRLGLAFMIGVDVQTLLGLVLYLFLSPITRRAFADFSAAMADADLRFYALEHVFYMVAALVFVHLGRSLPKSRTDPQRKYRLAAIFFTLAMVAILIAIPWSRL